MITCLTDDFFADDAVAVARKLLGKVITHYVNNIPLSAMIIETEAYYIHDKASHASLGFTQRRKALFMPPGTIYMYYARGKDSFNISCLGEGNAVLCKAGIPYVEADCEEAMLALMRQNNPLVTTTRPIEKWCSGQTLLCKTLGLKLGDWNQRKFCSEKLIMRDIGYRPTKIINSRRLGIPLGRDEHLLYRFIDHANVMSCTSNPLRKRGLQQGIDYFILDSD